MINDIKEALEYAPSGPWEVKYENYLPQIETLNGQLLALVRSEFRRSTIAHLIAQAPTYIRYLLDELEKARKEIETMRESLLSDGVYRALRYYQKQGLCEGNDYFEIDDCFETIGTLQAAKEQTNE